MGLLDSLKNMMGDQSASKATPAPAARPSQTTVVKGTPASAPSKDSIRVKFGSKMPYYDPEFGQLEISFNGFGEVISESWAKDPKANDFISQIIVNSITKGIMEAGKQKISYKDLPREAKKIREDAVTALKEKNFEVRSLALNTISLSPESRQQVEQAKKGQQ